ncbi:hypothetical protein L9F63_011344, partial [Diploptera punctata]
KLENDLIKAAKTRAVAQALKMEQQFEDDILKTAVTRLVAHRGDKEKQAEDLRELQDLVKRDKRQTDALSGALGSSSGSSSSGGDESGGGGGSNILSLLGSVLGGSSGS